jgi:hypothetical protein
MEDIMAIKLIWRPGEQVDWEEFKSDDFPNYSMAVDGFCTGGPRFSYKRRKLNINHHEGVDRLATRSSSDQSLMLVKMGLYETFCTENGNPKATIYCNDCDQDVTAATYILKYPERIDRPALKRLIRIEDQLDATGGMFPVKRNWHVVRQLAWIFAPYTDLRMQGGLNDLDADSMSKLVTVMHKRITMAITGRAKEIKLETEYNVLHKSTCWSLVQEIGAQARLAMVEDGIRAFVSFLGEHDGRFRYSVGRMSHFVPFPIYEIFMALNQADGISDWNPDRWGGSDSIGGSPRERLSSLAPEEVIAVIEEALKQYGQCRCPEHGVDSVNGLTDEQVAVVEQRSAEKVGPPIPLPEDRESVEADLPDDSDGSHEPDDAGNPDGDED